MRWGGFSEGLEDGEGTAFSALNIYIICNTKWVCALVRVNLIQNVTFLEKEGGSKSDFLFQKWVVGREGELFLDMKLAVNF